jgi:hypothetical protein
MERFDKYPTLLEAQNAAGFPLKVPQPRVDGFFQALVYRHVPNVLLCWHPGCRKDVVHQRSTLKPLAVLTHHEHY